MNVKQKSENRILDSKSLNTKNISEHKCFGSPTFHLEEIKKAVNGKFNKVPDELSSGDDILNYMLSH